MLLCDEHSGYVTTAYFDFRTKCSFGRPQVVHMTIGRHVQSRQQRLLRLTAQRPALSDSQPSLR